jgi:hypothetical protein
MAIGITSYADWLNQNPEDANAMASGFKATAPAGDPYAKFDLAPPAAPAQATPVQPIAAPVPASPVATPAAADSQPVKAMQAAPAEPIRKQKDTGDKGHDGILNIAKTIASFYTGGAASGISSMAGQSGGSNGEDAQGDDKSKWLSMLGSFGGGG